MAADEEKQQLTDVKKNKSYANALQKNINLMENIRKSFLTTKEAVSDIPNVKDDKELTDAITNAIKATDSVHAKLYDAHKTYYSNISTNPKRTFSNVPLVLKPHTPK